MARRMPWTSGRLHADGRIDQGFTPAQVLAEFRALRAAVLRLYEHSGHTDIAGVTRFNEAIDEVLTESIARYAAKTDLYRDQFTGILSHDLRTPLSAIIAGARRCSLPRPILTSGRRESVRASSTALNAWSA